MNGVDDNTKCTSAFEVLAGLEGMSGEFAASRITIAEQAEVRALHYEMLAHYSRRDLPGYCRLNAQIRAALNAAARNPVLTKTYPAINARMQSLRKRDSVLNLMRAGPVYLQMSPKY